MSYNHRFIALLYCHWQYHLSSSQTYYITLVFNPNIWLLPFILNLSGILTFTGGAKISSKSILSLVGTRQTAKLLSRTFMPFLYVYSAIIKESPLGARYITASIYLHIKSPQKCTCISCSDPYINMTWVYHWVRLLQLPSIKWWRRNRTGLVRRIHLTANRPIFGSKPYCVWRSYDWRKAC